MSTEIATITDSNKDLVRRNYCPSATPDEFEMFRAICNRYGLDPFCREAWFVKYGGAQAQIFVGRDGMLAIANRSGQFDGLETNPTFDEKGNLVSATCTVWRKDMSHPFTKTVYLKEYTTGKSLWNTKPITMLQKVAEAQALRAAFTISGLYCQEEMGIDEPVRIEPQSADIVVEPVKVKAAPAKPQSPQKAESAQKCSIYLDLEAQKIYERYVGEGWNTDVFAKAKLPSGDYNKDMIDADYQTHITTTYSSEVKPEPKQAPKQTRPSEGVSDEYCTKCGKRLLVSEVNKCKLIGSDMICDSCTMEVLQQRIKDKHGAKA